MFEVVEPSVVDSAVSGSDWLGSAVTVTVEPTTAGRFEGYTHAQTSGAATQTLDAFAPSETRYVDVYYVANADADYTVRYVLAGTDTEIAQSKVVDGQTFDVGITEQAIAIDGYTLVGEPTQTFAVGYGTVVTFEYTADAASIVFDANAGGAAVSGMPATIEGATGEPIEAAWPAAAPQRAGYTFVGWFDSPDGTGAALTDFPTDTFPAGTTTYYAVWSAIPPVVPGDGTGDGTGTPAPTPVIPGVPTPIDGAVATVVSPLAGAMQGAVEPLMSQGAEEFIGDDATPLASGQGGSHAACWVHYYMFLGLIIAAVYYAIASGRRAGFTSRLKEFEAGVLGTGHAGGNGSER